MDQYLPPLSQAARRWLRFVGLVLGLGVLCWLVYRLRAVFTPLLVAAAIAYVLNPLVTWFEKQRGVPRLTSVIVTFALLGMLVVGAGFYVSSRAAAQVVELERQMPAYIERVGQWIELVRRQHGSADPAAATGPAALFGAPAGGTQPAGGISDEWRQSAMRLLGEHGVGVARSMLGYMQTALSGLRNLVALLVIIPIFAFYFLWRFNDFAAAVRDHLPARLRDPVLHVVRTIDAAVANFFRGRLIVCLAVAVLTSVGWSVVGVPYSLPLGILTGVLNLVPFLSLLALPPALVFAYLGAAEAGGSWLWPVLLALGVYMGVQAVESFVLSPVIEGRSSGLHPLLIVVALLIGAQLAGLLGMLLAVPVASTLKTLAAELLLPELRRAAAPTGPGGKEPGRADPQPPGCTR